MIPDVPQDRNLKVDDKLFIQTGETLAWMNRSFQELGNYADCYQHSALALIDIALSEERYRDYKIYPIVFLIRHYFELRLKELIKGVNYLEKQTEEFPTHHKLNSLWQNFRSKYSAVVEKLDSKDEVIISMTNLIAEISILDPDSMSFRYPTDLDGNIFEKPDYIELNNLKTVFIRSCRVLDSMAIQISMHSETVRDMLQEAYSYYDSYYDPN
jgi:hypothetical protein